MGKRYRCLMLGAGGMGSRWIREIWQPFRDRMEFAGLVDPDPTALREAGDWLDGGPPPATLADNLQSTAMLFAAIRAAETGMTVDVKEMVRELAGAV